MTTEVFKKLRRKMFLGMLSVLFVLLVTYVVVFNMYMQFTVRRNAGLFLSELVLNDGLSPYDEHDYAQRLSGSSMRLRFLWGASDHRGTPYFSAWISDDGTVREVIHPFSGGMSREEEQLLVDSMLGQNRRFGMDRSMAFRIDERTSSTLLVAFDRTKEVEMERRMLFVFLALTFVAIGVLAAVVWAISKFITAPVEKEFIKQREFIADVSHELKTPIAVIGANISVLENDIPGNKWLAYIKAESQRMNTLVHDMLFLAKEDSGRLELTVTDFDLANAVSCAVLPFESVAFEGRRTLELDVPKEPLMVQGDEGKIKQVAIILTDNAMKNSFAGSLIRVSVGGTSDRCFITVYNTGTGIPEKDLESIFDRFYRVDKSRNRSTGGYGLGLAIAQAIAAEHGGKISVRSEEQSYAQFTFEFPRAPRKRIPFFG